MTTFPVILVLASNVDGHTVAEFQISTTADVVAAHTELLRLARTVSSLANDPVEALPVQSEVNALVLGDSDYVTALGYTLAVKPEPQPEPEPEAAEEAAEETTETRLGKIEAMLAKFAAKFGVSL